MTIDPALRVLDRPRMERLDYLISVNWGHVPSMIIEAVVDEAGELPMPLPREFSFEHWMSPDVEMKVGVAKGWAQQWATRFFRWRERARAEAKGARV